MVATALAAAFCVTLIGTTSAFAATADTTPPTQPGAITASGVTATSVSLSWGRSADNVAIEGYRIYRSVGSGITPTTLIATTDAVNSYSATHLYSGRTYTFGVMAIDPSDNKSVMTTKTVTTATSTDTTAPAAPSTSSVSFRVFSSSRVDVVWGASTSTDIAGYKVLRNASVVGTIDLPNTPRFSDTLLTASTSYSYTIKAVDSAGNLSAPTTAKTATTLASNSVIIARGPLLSKITGSSGVISWWTNLATAGAVTINGATVTDPAGSTQHHVVTITGLSTGVSYPYTVTSNGVSAGGTLRTAAARGQAFSFVAIGDFGGGSVGETQNATDIAGAGTQFIQTVGDNVYPSAGLPDPNFSTTYSDFDQRMFKPFAAAIRSQAFFPANGNKEYYGDGEFWSAYPVPGTNHSWYSYNWGDAHILVLDSEQPFTTGTDQYNFAQADLAANQGATWRIVAIQRPPYSSSSANSSSLPVRQYLVPLFQAEHVNLVLSGNSHNYERTVPMTDGAAASSGITYVVSGAGGNGFNTFTVSQPSYTAFREASYYQYTKITVSPTALTIDAVRADTNAVFDTTTITATGTPPPPDTSAPSVPTNVTATPVSASGIDLAWAASTDNVGVTGYRIYRDGATTPLATVTGTSYHDTGLTASTSYSYRVSAVDAAGNNSGPSSPAATAQTKPASTAGTPTLVQAAEGTTSTGLTATFPHGTAAGNLLVLTAAVYTGATSPISSVTDSANNSWLRAAAGPYFVSGHNSDGEIWYAANAKPATTVTVHSAATSVALQAQEYAGVTANSPLDSYAGAANTGTTATAGPITAASGELVVGFVAGHGNTQAITIAGPFTPTQPQTTATSGSITSIATGYQVLTSTSSPGISATFGTAMYWAAGLAAFKPGP